jgi:hypothetical protein
MISSADFTRPLPGLGAVGTAQPTRGGDPHPGTGRERSRSCRADPLAVSVQFRWPSALRNLAVCVQDLVAADIRGGGRSPAGGGGAERPPCRHRPRARRAADAGRSSPGEESRGRRGPTCAVSSRVGPRRQGLGRGPTCSSVLSGRSSPVRRGAAGEDRPAGVSSVDRSADIRPAGASVGCTNETPEQLSMRDMREPFRITTWRPCGERRVSSRGRRAPSSRPNRMRDGHNAPA